MKQQENASLVRNVLMKAQKPGTLSGLTHTQLSEVFGMMKLQIAQALPKHLTPERMIQVACNLVARNPQLGECTASSVMGAVIQTSILGLSLIEQMGECALIPYNRNVGTKESPKWIKEAQMQVMYRGYVKLAHNSGEISNVYAYAVYPGDQFNYELGLNPKIEHKPLLEDNTGKEILYVYAVANHVGGGQSFIVIPRSKVEKLRKSNPMQKGDPSGAWYWYEEMAKGKSIKQLAKTLPLSTDKEDRPSKFQQAVIADESVVTERALAKDGTGIILENLEYTQETLELLEEPKEPKEPKEQKEEKPKAEKKKEPEKEEDQEGKLKEPLKEKPKQEDWQPPDPEKINRGEENISKRIPEIFD